jgi:hypothetical protein
VVRRKEIQLKIVEILFGKIVDNLWKIVESGGRKGILMIVIDFDGWELQGSW